MLVVTFMSAEKAQIISHPSLNRNSVVDRHEKQREIGNNEFTIVDVLQHDAQAFERKTLQKHKMTSHARDAAGRMVTWENKNVIRKHVVSQDLNALKIVQNSVYRPRRFWNSQFVCVGGSMVQHVYINIAPQNTNTSANAEVEGCFY